VKALRYDAPYQISILELPAPVPAAGEVLLKMISVGVCGSDMQIYHGKHRYMTFPVIGGHEGSAVVEAAGEGVEGFRPGDRVAIEPQVTCGTCYPCSIGRFNVCENLKVLGTHQDGLMCEYVALDAKYLHLCPPDMPFDRITLVEPLAVAVGSVKRAHYRGANVAVIGAGTIGNLIAQAAGALGAGDVLITDVVDAKLEYARACGVAHAVNTRSCSLKNAILQTFGPRKADVIIDAAGLPLTFQAALDASRPSSEIVLTANYKEPVTLTVPQMQRREVNLIGHMMYVREDYQDAIRLLYEGRVRVDGFITQRFPLKDAADGYRSLDQNPGAVMKAVIDIA